MSKKWLLDHNLPKQLAEFLRNNGIDCNWTSAEGWQTLANGALVKAASDAGYVCLLTNDRKFANAAGNALASKLFCCRNHNPTSSKSRIFECDCDRMGSGTYRTSVVKSCKMANVVFQMFENRLSGVPLDFLASNI